MMRVRRVWSLVCWNNTRRESIKSRAAVSDAFVAEVLLVHDPRARVRIPDGAVSVLLATVDEDLVLVVGERVARCVDAVALVQRNVVRGVEKLLRGGVESEVVVEASLEEAPARRVVTVNGVTSREVHFRRHAGFVLLPAGLTRADVDD